jgi:hypothetical protein
MSSVFFTQGTVLNLELGDFVLPVASLHIFNGNRGRGRERRKGEEGRERKGGRGREGEEEGRVRERKGWRGGRERKLSEKEGSRINDLRDILVLVPLFHRFLKEEEERDEVEEGRRKGGGRESETYDAALGIIILVPLFDRILYPFLKSRNIQFGMLRRIGTGFFLATIGMIYAGRK